jgi:hypothetical protein
MLMWGISDFLVESVASGQAQFDKLVCDLVAILSSLRPKPNVVDVYDDADDCGKTDFVRKEVALVNRRSFFNFANLFSEQSTNIRGEGFIISCAPRQASTEKEKKVT